MLLSDGRSVLDVLNQEVATCRELADLRQEQRRLIDAGEAEQLLRLLARKQEAIGRITTFEDQIRPLKSDWEARKQAFPASQRIAIGDAFREVRGLLESLIADENADVEALAARKNAARSDLETFDSKRRLEATYRPSQVVAESRYLDQKDA